MKYQDIVKLTSQELTEKLIQERNTLQKLTLTHKLNKIENPMRIRYTRKTIAQIKTAQNISNK